VVLYIRGDFAMKIKAILKVLVLIALVFALNNEVLAQKAEYKLQQTDVLQITVHEHLDLTTKTRVTADGYITFPLLGNIYVEDLTVQALEKKIKDLLEEDYLVSAQVVVFIEKYHPRQVSVIGEVKKPGKYKMPSERDMTLLEAIAMAEGFTEDADINNTEVIRMEDGEKKIIHVKVKNITGRNKKAKDITLQPDDVVFVPESFF